MSMDANYQSVPPAQSMRINNFKLKPISFGTFPIPFFPIVSTSGFFADNLDDKNQWDGPLLANLRVFGRGDDAQCLLQGKPHRRVGLDLLHRHRPRSNIENIISRITLSEFSTPVFPAIQNTEAGKGQYA